MSVVTVKLDLEKFYPRKLTIHEGQTVNWEFDNGVSDSCQQAEYVSQILSDDVNSLEVEGGFRSSSLETSKEWRLTFNRVGEYHFRWRKLSPMTVKVAPKLVMDIEVSRKGFSAGVLQLYTGDVIRWKFTGNANAIVVKKMELCMRHGGFVTTDTEYSAAFSHSRDLQFTTSGLHYYCIDDGAMRSSLCVFQVVEKTRDFDLTLDANGFDQELMQLNKEDRLWCKWNVAKKSETLPSIQIHCIASLDGREQGERVFQSQLKTARGLLSFVFSHPGLYEVRETMSKSICIIKVVAKCKQHSIALSDDCFVPALGSASAGDCVWITNDSTQDSGDVDVHVDGYDHLEGEHGERSAGCCTALNTSQAAALRSLGLTSFRFAAAGVVSLKATRQHDDKRRCDLIIYPTTQCHVVDLNTIVNDNQLIHVKENDTLWLEWQRCRWNVNEIRQVTLRGTPLSAADQPSIGSHHALSANIGVHMMRLSRSGVVNLAGYDSQKRKGPILTVIVQPRKKIHKVRVTPRSLSEDPVFATMGDIVCWVWPKSARSCLAEADVSCEVACKGSEEYSSRRCICRRFDQEGVSHFSCGYSGKETDDQIVLPESVWCSVICDAPEMPNVVHLTQTGFRSQVHYIEQYSTTAIDFGMSQFNAEQLEWSIGDLNDHDMIQSNLQPDSYSSIHPVVCFNHVLLQCDLIGISRLRACVSGQSFLLVVVCVAPGRVHHTPTILADSNIANVEEGHQVMIRGADSDENISILYTLNGTVPSKDNPSSQVLHGTDGVRLLGAGLLFVRIVAIGDTALPSHVATSRRFWVMEESDDASCGSSQPCSSTSCNSVAAEQVDKNLPVVMESQRTMKNVDITGSYITVTFISENAIRVTLDTNRQALSTPREFAICIDGVVCGPVYPSSCPSVIISGLTAGKGYALAVMMFREVNDTTPLAMLSNEMLVTCPTVSALHGPVISLEWCKHANEVSVLWMSNYHPSKRPVTFHVLLNGNTIGKVIAGESVGYCSVLLNGLDTGCLHEVVVKAEIEGEARVYPSNPLEFILPITQPPELSEKPGTSAEDCDNSAVHNAVPPVALSEEEQPREVLFFSQTNGGKPVLPVVMGGVESKDGLIASLASRIVNEAVQGALLDVVVENLVADVISSVETNAEREEDRGLVTCDDVENETYDDRISAEMPSVRWQDEVEGKISRVARNLVKDVVNRALQEIRIQFDTETPSNQNGDAELEGRAVKKQSLDNDSFISDAASNLVASAVNEAMLEITRETAERLAADAIALAIEELEANPSNDNNVHSNTCIELRSSDTDGDSSTSQHEDEAGVNSECKDEAAVGKMDGSTASVGIAEANIHDIALTQHNNSSSTEQSMSDDRTVNGRWVSAQDAQTLPPSDLAIHVQPTDAGKITVTWRWSSDYPGTRVEVVYQVLVLGLKFEDVVNSQACYTFDTSPLPEAWPSSDDNAARSACAQHSWETEHRALEVEGLKPRYTYSIWLVVKNTKSGERITTGKTLYTIPGPPSSPVVAVDELLDRAVLLSWRPSTSYGEALVSGYVVLLNGRELGDVIPATDIQTTVSGLEPGTVNEIALVAIASGSNDQRSKPSESIFIRCPSKPCSVDTVVQVNVEELGAIMLSWTVPLELWQQLQDSHKETDAPVNAEDVGFLVIVNGVVMSSYTLTDGEETILHKITGCHAGVLHNVTVKSYMKPVNNRTIHTDMSMDLSPGNDANNNISKHERRISRENTQGSLSSAATSPTYTCGCSSDASNPLIAAPISPPASPKLLIKQMSRHGIEVAWERAQTFGFAKLSGYFIFVNGELRSEHISPDAVSFRLSDLCPGNDYIITLTSVTNHRIGSTPPNGYTTRITNIGNIARSPVKKVSVADSLMEGFTAFSDCRVPGYEGCVCGPPLIVYYKDLSYPVKDVVVVDVSGISARITWHVAKGASLLGDQDSAFVSPMSFVVSLWRTGNHRKLIKEKETTGTSVILSYLEPGSEYCVAVKSRTAHLNDKDMADTRHPFVCWEESQPVYFSTNLPPLPPSELRIVKQTRDSVQLNWEDIVERGVPVHKVILQCISKGGVNSVDGRGLHSVSVLPPEQHGFTVEQLSERTEHLFTLYLVTAHSDKADVEALTGGDIIHDSWTPCVSSVVTTPGFDCPACIDVTHVDAGCVRLQWICGVAYGSYVILRQTVCWRIALQDVDAAVVVDKSMTQDRLDVPCHMNEATVKGLKQGQCYLFHIEAVLSNGSTNETGADADDANVAASTSIVVWTRAPPCRPTLLASVVSVDAIQLTWNRPCLMSNDPASSFVARRSLLGYKLYFDADNYCLLPASDTKFQMESPGPDKEYQFVLNVVTCSEEAFKSHISKWQRLVSAPRAFAIPSSPYHAEFGDIDSSRSDMLCIRLPADSDRVRFTSIECRYAKRTTGREAILSTSVKGSMIVRWRISAHHGFDTFKVAWWKLNDPDNGSDVVLNGTGTRTCEISEVDCRSIYGVCVVAMGGTAEETVPSPIVHCQVPGAPDPPAVALKTVNRNGFTLEWNEPMTYGNVKIGGYHVFINDNKLGKLLPITSRSCTIPCRIGRSYRVAMSTLSMDLSFPESELSKEVVVYARPETTAADHDPNERHPLIEVDVSSVRDTSIDIEWKDHEIDADSPIEYYVIQYSSVSTPKPNKITVLAGQKKYSIKRCKPGTTYFVSISAFDRRKGLLARGVNQMTVQTSAQIETPVLETRESSATKITIGWKRPTQYGDALLTSYLLKLDGRDYAEIDKDDTTYEFSFCEPCHKYRFEIQALCCKRIHHSKLSDVLSVECPGAEKIILARIQSNEINTVHVGWRKPILRGNAKVKQYTVLYCRSDPGDVALTSRQIVDSDSAVLRGPYAPSTMSDKIEDLDPSFMYHVVLRVDLTPDDIPSLFSKPIRTKPAIPPNPPNISAKVLDLQERKVKEENIAMLLTSRDYCCKRVNNLRGIQSNGHSERQINQLLVLIAKIDTEIRSMLRSLKQLTGFVRVSLSWYFPGHDGDAVARGYRMLCDNEPYGELIPLDCCESTVQLLCDGKQHTIAMVTVTDHPIGPSPPSNVMTISTQEFLPFSLFCYHDVHRKGASWPDRGCCVYGESYAHEHNAKWNQNGRPAPFRGMMVDDGYPLTAKGIDISDGVTTPIVSRATRMTVVAFYTFWCKTSRVMMDRLAQLVKEMTELDFVTCCTHGAESSTNHRFNMLERLDDMGFVDRPNVRHLCICQRSADSQFTKRIINADRRSAVTTADLCDVVGVPTLMIVNLAGEIAWQGRICCTTQPHFSSALRHFVDLVHNGQCKQTACLQCSSDESCLTYLETVMAADGGETTTFLTGVSPRHRVVLRQNLFPEIPSSGRTGPPRRTTKLTNGTTATNHNGEHHHSNGGGGGGSLSNYHRNTFPPASNRLADSGITTNGSHKRVLSQKANSEKQIKAQSLQNHDFPSISPHPPKQKRKEMNGSSQSFRRSYSAPHRKKAADS